MSDGPTADVAQRSRSDEPFAPDCFYEVTIRYWGRTESEELRSPLTRGQAEQANREALDAVGGPIYVRPADLVALGPSAPHGGHHRRGLTGFFRNRRQRGFGPR